MPKTDCYVCYQPASQEAVTGDFKVVRCDGCGNYEINGSSIAVMAGYDQAMREQALTAAKRRARLSGAAIPTIEQLS